MTETQKPPEMWQLRDEDDRPILEVGEDDDGETTVHLLDDGYDVVEGWPGT